MSQPAPPSLTGTQTVTSEEVITSIFFSLVGGLLFMAAWAYLRGPLRSIYEKRVQLPDLLARPPPLRLSGALHRCAGFLAPVFTLSDGELMRTAGLDALVLTRFLVLGVQVFVPVAALCCAVLIPLCMTGTVVDTAQYISTASIMRYTLSNVEQGSPKLWASFALSYGVLAWVGYCLYQSYKSYALYRLLHLRTAEPAGRAPRMAVVGMQPRGWREVGDAILKLLSPLYMLRCDMAYVRQALEQLQEMEGAAAPGGDGDGGAARGSSQEGEGGEEIPLKAGLGGEAAVLPWWLPPEQVPAEFTAAWGTSGVIAGKTCPTLRKRVLARNAAGVPVWVSAESYSVLLTSAGPPPSRSLWALLRPPGSQAPSAVLVEGAEEPDALGSKPGGAEEEEQQQDEQQEPGQGQGRQGRTAAASGSARMELVAAGGEAAGRGAEEVAAQLTQELQDLFPGSFTHLVRVHNHHAVDRLLVQHDAAATQRDRLAGAAAQTRLAADAAGEGAAGAEAAGGAAPRKAAKVAARLATVEAALAAQQARVEQLEQEIEAARQAALERPVGTAFIALFSDQTAAATAALVQASLVPTANFNVRPCPGPDNLNWAALWTSYTAKAVRGLAVIPLLAAVMLFPIGVLTGALSNLSTAVCGGTPETNSLYWPWYCQQGDFGSRLVKSLLQGMLPSIISMLWDTYVLPMVFFFTSQAELRHLSLSDLDARMLVLFCSFNISNTFLGSVLGGAVFQQIGNLVSEPGYWLTMLGTSLPTASTYFLNYILIHALCTNCFRFMWPHEGTVLFVIFRLVGLFRPRCGRDHAMIRTAPSYRSARHFGSFSLIFLMALSYAVVAPLVLPAAAGFFVTAWITWRYCAIYFYERSYESGGRMFERLFTLMVWTMAFFSIFTSIVLGAKRAYTPALILLITQLIGLMLYHRKVTLSVGHYARTLPLASTLGMPRVRVDPATFLPPPLRKQAVGWYPEWGKVWEKYGVSRYSF